MSPNLEPVLTQHTRARMQQRGIPPATVEALLLYGREVHDRRGGVIVCFDHATRRRLRRAGESRQRVGDRRSNVYLVVADGVIATVGHRTRRLPHH